MIVFLTLCYTAIIYILAKLKVIPWNNATKLSPLAFLVLLLIVLFIPMQWGAPSMFVQVFRLSVQIVPNVAGEVIEVPVVANAPLEKGDVLFRIDPRPYEYALAAKRAALAEAEQAVPQLVAALESAEASVDQAVAQRDRSKQIYERYSGANVQGSVQPFSEQEVETRRLTYLSNEAALQRAIATARQAEMAATSEIDGINTTVARLRAEVLQAEYDLGETTVRAPSDGFVTNLALLPGARVVTFPFSPAMAFFDTTQTILGGQVAQIFARHIKPGQPVEVAFKALPGRVIPATVVDVLAATAAGQAAPSGTAVSSFTPTHGPILVRMRIDDPEVAAALPAGATGEAAIYTQSVAFTHVIRKVMMRMNAWLNYLVP